ncbi:MAG: response regulator [Candidatus Omnitrophica bacterium]|nr:response regulator [Candidatus Omnitrophota bacterium]
MRVTIRSKITFFTLLLVFISIGVLGTHLSRIAEKSLKERIGQGMKIQASSMMGQIDRMMFERYQNMDGWAKEPIMMDLLKDDKEGRIRDFLLNMKKEYGLYRDLMAVDLTGTLVASSNPKHVRKNIREEPWFKGALKSTEITVFSLISTEFPGGPTTLFAAPLHTQDLINQIKAESVPSSETQRILEVLESWKTPVLGILVAVLEWNEMTDLLNFMPVLEGKDQTPQAYALLVNKDGIALTQPYFDEKAVMFTRNLRTEGIKAAAFASEGKNGYTIEPGHYGTLDFISYASSSGYRDFNGFGWSLLVFQSAERALSPIRHLQMQVFLLGILVALLASVISLFLTQSITRPVEKLADFTRTVAKGDFSGSIDVTSSDEIGMLAGSFNDMIKNLSKAQIEIVQSRDFTDNIIKSILDPLIVIDSSGRIQTTNPAATKLLGFETKELENYPVEALFSEESRREHENMEKIRQGKAFNVDMEYKTKDGALIPVLLSVTALRDSHGREHGKVLISRDMREYKALERQFREAQKMDAIGKLAGGVAHDFNNMLTVINGYSEKILMFKENENLAVRSDINQILKAGRKASALTRQLLSFSRRQVTKPVSVNLNEVINGMIKMLKLIGGGNIEIVVIPTEDIWTVKIDPGQFEQVLANLTVNARDAMPDGGRISFSTKNEQVTEAPLASHEELEAGSYVCLSISDTGTGMTEEIKKKIFEPFFTTKPVGKGTGLGLATCWNFMKEARGFIEVDTELGKGTTFHLYLPKSTGKAMMLSLEDFMEPLPRGVETLLLVEDEDLVREFAHGILTDLGYKILVALNGSEALRLAEEHTEGKIDLLLTDVVMPKMNGRELAERLLALKPGIKVLFMSGYVDDDFIEKNAAGIKMPLLEKPLTPSALAKKVREVLDEGKKA